MSWLSIDENEIADAVRSIFGTNGNTKPNGMQDSKQTDSPTLSGQPSGSQTLQTPVNLDPPAYLMPGWGPSPGAGYTGPVNLDPATYRGAAPVPALAASPIMATAGVDTYRVGTDRSLAPIPQTQRAGPSRPGPDLSFIYRQENDRPDGQKPNQLNLPIPDRPLRPGKIDIYANTGFTTGAGVDLYGRTVESLKDMGVSDDGVRQLVPLLSLRGADAKAYQDDLPRGQLDLPQLTEADGEALRQGAMNQKLSELRNRYNTDRSPGSPSFDELHPNLQTAMLDLAYQSKPLWKAAPRFWDAVTTGDWGGAQGELNNYYGQRAQPTPHDLLRRQREADLISQVLQK